MVRITFSRSTEFFASIECDIVTDTWWDICYALLIPPLTTISWIGLMMYTQARYSRECWWSAINIYFGPSTIANYYSENVVVNYLISKLILLSPPVKYRGEWVCRIELWPEDAGIPRDVNIYKIHSQLAATHEDKWKLYLFTLEYIQIIPRDIVHELLKLFSWKTILSNINKAHISAAIDYLREECRKLF